MALFTFQCIIADSTSCTLVIVKGQKNIQTINNLKHLIHKCKIEITDIGVSMDFIRVTEKLRLLFDDEVCNLYEFFVTSIYTI